MKFSFAEIYFRRKYRITLYEKAPRIIGVSEKAFDPSRQYERKSCITVES
jgi:hypothetical protein